MSQPRTVSASKQKESGDAQNNGQPNQAEPAPEKKKEDYRANRERKRKEEREKERARKEKEEEDRKAKADQERKDREQIEEFKSKDRLTLELMHAFGCFTGEANQWKGNITNCPQMEIQGHIHVFLDLQGMFSTKDQSSKINGGQKEDMGSFKDLTVGSDHHPPKVIQTAEFSEMVIMYPVGRHVAFRCLETHKMKFIQLPNHVHTIQCLAVNNKKDVVAIGVKIWDTETGVNAQNQLEVLFYRIEQHQFKKFSNIKLSRGAGINGQGLVPQYVKSRKRSDNKQMKIFDRFVKSMSFSHDDKQIVVVINNGPNQSVVKCYDMIMKSNAMSQKTFDEDIIDAKFLPRDPKKVLLTGENIIKQYYTTSKQLIKYADFDDVPFQEPIMLTDGSLVNQVFTSFCYTDFDQTVACTNMGEIMVIESIAVVQIIEQSEFIEPGTKIGSRLNFKKVIPCRFGFVAYTNDVIYFLEFRESAMEMAKKSKKNNADDSKGSKHSQKNLAKEPSGLLGGQKQSKGTYHCVLKWRAEEFRGTEIMDISVCDGVSREDTTMAITTKDNQILYLNLYSQVYFPDHVKIMDDLKGQVKGHDPDISSDSNSGSNSDQELLLDGNAMRAKKGRQIKIIGIEEEDSVDQLLKKKRLQGSKNHNVDEQKKEIVRLENQALIDQINYRVVANGFHKGEISCMDICVQRPIICTLSKEDSTIRVWNYASGECELEKNYEKMQEEFQSTDNTYLQSIALHPSGFYMAIGFIDKVKIYHLMQADLREFQVLDIKNCHTMKFSNGGQLLACIDFKEISLFYSYALDKPRKQPCPSKDVEQLDFNKNDTMIAVVSKDGFVQKYDITKGMEKRGESVIDKQCHFYSCIFSRHEKQEPNNSNLQNFGISSNKTKQYEDKIYTVGNLSTGETLIRCYGADENKDKDGDLFQKPEFEGSVFTDIVELCYDANKHKDYDPDFDILKKNEITNLAATLNNGRLVIYGLQPNLKKGREIDVINTHFGAVTSLKRSHDSSILISAGKDGVIFVYRVSDAPNKNVGAWSSKVKKMKDRNEQEMKIIVNQSYGQSPLLQQNQQQEGSDDDSAAAQAQQQQKQQQTQMRGMISESEDSDDADIQDLILQRRKAQTLYSVIDDRLSNCVLIDKQTMDEWRKQQEDLKLDMEKENNTVETQLRNEKYDFEKDIAKMERGKSEELNILVKKYEQLQQQEADEKEDNNHAMKKMELEHNQCMEELQSLYEKKLQLEQKEFNRLKQEKDEMEGAYKQECEDIIRLKEKNTEQLLDDFKNELQKVQDKYDEEKRRADGLKMMYEEKLTQQDEENTTEVNGLKESTLKEKEQMNDLITTLGDDIKSIQREKEREKDEAQQFIDERDKNYRQMKDKKDDMAQKEKVIKQLDQEKLEIQQKLKEKEGELYQFKFRIKDLQKTKKVLTHRTQEMKASLEPKEQQIENLKDKLLVLEKSFFIQTKSMERIEKKIEQHQALIKIWKQKLDNEKSKTKERQQTISSFVTKVHSAYKSKNDDVYIKKLMELYRDYVEHNMSQVLQNKKKDPDTINELERQKAYLIKSIATLKMATMKNESKTKENKMERMRENNGIIEELKKTRDKKKELEIINKKIELEIQTLKQEKNKRINDQNNFQEQLYDLYKKVSINKDGAQGVVEGVLPGGDKSQAAVGLRPAKPKGRLYKGTPFLRGNSKDKLMIQGKEVSKAHLIFIISLFLKFMRFIELSLFENQLNFEQQLFQLVFKIIQIFEQKQIIKKSLLNIEKINQLNANRNNKLFKLVIKVKTASTLFLKLYCLQKFVNHQIQINPILKVIFSSKFDRKRKREYSNFSFINNEFNNTNYNLFLLDCSRGQ